MDVSEKDYTIGIRIYYDGQLIFEGDPKVAFGSLSTLLKKVESIDNEDDNEEINFSDNSDCHVVGEKLEEDNFADNADYHVVGESIKKKRKHEKAIDLARGVAAHLFDYQKHLTGSLQDKWEDWAEEWVINNSAH